MVSSAWGAVPWLLYAVVQPQRILSARLLNLYSLGRLWNKPEHAESILWKDIIVYVIAHFAFPDMLLAL